MAYTEQKKGFQTFRQQQQHLLLIFPFLFFYFFRRKTLSHNLFVLQQQFSFILLFKDETPMYGMYNARYKL